MGLFDKEIGASGFFDWLKPTKTTGAYMASRFFGEFLDLYQGKVRLSEEIIRQMGKENVAYNEDTKRLMRTLYVINSKLAQKLSILYKQNSTTQVKLTEEFTRAIQHSYNQNIKERPALQKTVLDEKVRVKIQQFSDFAGYLLGEWQKQNQNRDRARQAIENPEMRLAVVASLKDELTAYKVIRIFLVRFLKILRDAKLDDEDTKEIEERKDINIRLEPLSPATLSQATALVREVFPDQGTDEPARYCFRASLYPDAYKEFLEKIGVTELRYWVAMDGNRVVGTTGLYCYADDQKTSYWLGWMCVEPRMRGRKISRIMMDAMLTIAKQAGKKYLKLYTSDDPNEETAQIVYEKYGLKTKEREPIHNSPYNYLFRQVRL